MRAVFFGTPALAVPTLRALCDISEVVGVVCQPDRPAGRGLVPQAPAVKSAALELGCEVYQPEKVRNGELERWLREREPDVAVVLAYGRILPKGVLEAPRRGCVNLHASLLPRYRGAAPIQWAILRGERETGISMMQIDEGLDSGPVFSRHAIPIGENETAGELAERLANLGAEILRAELATIVEGRLTSQPQDPALATLAPPLERVHGRLDWSRPAQQLHDQVRGLAPKPGAFTSCRGKQVRLARTHWVATAPALLPGQVRVERPRVLIGTGDGAIELLRAQFEGKKELDALSLVNGRYINDGDLLGDEPKPTTGPG
ncbi:MAG TPA: methionyl-tRNA formyltransferase [Polyangiaceae bacterium]|nr:methionyl-tRNA formyltransferase [Polyangiaceae bacterium]